jgi:hypothetical protein
MPDTSTVWLEVTNVRSFKTVGKRPTVQIQVKGDRAEPEPEWWDLNKGAYIENAAKTYRTLSENLEKKRIVLAALGAVDNGTLECKHFRIQYADSAGR